MQIDVIIYLEQYVNSGLLLLFFFICFLLAVDVFLHAKTIYNLTLFN